MKDFLSIVPGGAKEIEGLFSWLPGQSDIHWTIDDLESYRQKPGYSLLVAVLENETAGFLISQLVLDESNLLMVAVDPKWRGQRVGAQLVNRFLDMSVTLDASMAHLEVRESNRAAIALYESMGFEQVGKRGHYYPPLQGEGARESALLFSRQLSDRKD